MVKYKEWVSTKGRVDSNASDANSCTLGYSYL